MYSNTYFPTTIVDRFFDNPSAIRTFALSQSFKSDEGGEWPGYRTQNLISISPVIFHNICQKILSLFYTKKQEYFYEASACFQIIDKNFESGWVHKDNSIITTIIYLTPESNSGTSLYIKNKIDYNDITYNTDKKDSYKSGLNNGILRDLNNQNYSETLNVGGLFNRMLSFDGNMYHAAHDFFGDSKEESRLTLVVFINSLTGDLETPLHRCRSYGRGTIL